MEGFVSTFKRGLVAHYGIRANAVAPGVIGRVEAMPAFQKEASSS
jgi:NAD(P)-dependent dehydrogenase (short-subunit alcohol dehydrogenase family)